MKFTSISGEEGFSLIEVLVFIIVTGMAMSAILFGVITTLRSSPTTHNQLVALQTAQQCMEWFIGQRHLIGYAALSCPGTPSVTACSAPAGFSVAASISCTTRSGDAYYKTIGVTVSGAAAATITSLVGNY